jgi:hypothetical protein
MKPWQRFLIISSSSTLALALFPAPSKSQAIESFCAAAKENVSSDSRLSEAAKAVFGSPEFSSQNEDCIYPLQVLHYAGADVLLAIGNAPGQACHGCTASLSAYAMRRKASGLQLVKRFIDFGQLGSSGNPGEISPIEIVGDDGFVVESGGTFQGYTSSSLDCYVFRQGRIVHLVPTLALSADNSGVGEDSTKEVSVDGAWTIGHPAKDNLSIEYKVVTKGRTSISRAVWEFRGDKLLLKSGLIPPELKKAAGG